MPTDRACARCLGQNPDRVGRHADRLDGPRGCPRTALAGTVASLARPAEPWLGVPLRPRGPPSLPETLTSSIAVELTPARLGPQADES